jgi:hypothetical protein
VPGGIRRLLMGEGITPKSEKEIRSLVKNDQPADEIHKIFSIY